MPFDGLPHKGAVAARVRHYPAAVIRPDPPSQPRFEPRPASPPDPQPHGNVAAAASASETATSPAPEPDIVQPPPGPAPGPRPEPGPDIAAWAAGAAILLAALLLAGLVLRHWLVKRTRGMLALAPSFDPGLGGVALGAPAIAKPAARLGVRLDLGGVRAAPIAVVEKGAKDG
jgi:hypothetical protein